MLQIELYIIMFTDIEYLLPMHMNAFKVTAAAAAALLCNFDCLRASLCAKEEWLSFPAIYIYI